MIKTKRNNLLSVLLIMSLVIGAIGIANVDTSFAATKKVHLKKATVSITVGKTYQQKLIDKKGKTIKATKVKWKSKKTSVAKINKKGKITAVKAGTAKMTAKYKGKTYKFTVKVKKPTPPVVEVTSVTFDTDSSFDMDKGATRQITATVAPINATSKEIVWSSSDPSIASVDQNGLVTAVNYGYCDIRATASNGIYAEKRVRVGRMEFDRKTVTVNVNETVTVNLYSQYRLVGGVKYGADYVDLEWGNKSSDSTNTYTEELLITGKKVGTTTIRAYSLVDENIYTLLTVKVVEPKDINTLISYLKQNGDITVQNQTSQGTRMTKISYESDTREVFFSNYILTQSGNNLAMSQEALFIKEDFDIYIDKPYCSFRWDFYPEGNTDSGMSYRLEAHLNPRTYTPGDAIEWTILQEYSGVPAEELGLIEGASSNIERAIGYWNSALNNALGMTLADVGMANCK